MGQAFIIPAWVGLVIGFAVAAFLLAVATKKMRLLARLRGRTETENIALAVTARISFEGSSPPSLFLIALLGEGLYLHGIFSSHEMVIPGPSITYVGISEQRRWPRLADPVTVRFLNTEGKEVGFVFRTLSPAFWVAAVKTRLFDK